MSRPQSLCILLILFQATAIFSQIPDDEQPAMILAHGISRIGADIWATGGAALASSDMNSAVVNCPAFMRSSGWHGYAECGQWSKGEWLSEVKRNRQRLLPSLTYIGKNLKFANIAIGYANLYDMNWDYGVVERTTIEEPYGTGETFQMTSRLRTESYFLAARFQPHRLLSIGVNAGLAHIKQSDKIYQTRLTGDGFGFATTISAGLQVLDNLALACNYRFITTIKYDAHFEPELEIINPLDIDPSFGENDLLVSTDVVRSIGYIAAFPRIFETGGSWDINGWLSLHGALDFQNWRVVNDEYNDVINVHIGSNFRISNVQLSIGYFSQQEPVGSSFRLVLDQHFVSAGINVRVIKSLAISCAVMDSHLIKSKGAEDKYMLTYGSAGVGISF
ncbi:hypothetical protein EH223_01770 [candidate division KSB1 bacterium]|nr:hypothetical protein [candidate division KSB1 bacterium]RQW06770.1 MAG: hypothetical protein EH223_01770 [candidate division KSB1 bacterium]